MLPSNVKIIYQFCHISNNVATYLGPVLQFTGGVLINKDVLISSHAYSGHEAPSFMHSYDIVINTIELTVVIG